MRKANLSLPVSIIICAILMINCQRLATVVSSPTPTPDITVSFVSTEEDIGISLQYPEEWLLESNIDASMLVVSTNRELSADVISGQLFFSANESYNAFTEESFVLIFTDSTDELVSNDPMDIVISNTDDLIDLFSTSVFTIERISGPTEIVVNGQNRAKIVYAGSLNESPIFTLIFSVIVSENRYAIAFGITQVDSETYATPVLEAIFDSIEVSNPREPNISDELFLLSDIPHLTPGSSYESTLAKNQSHYYWFDGVAGQSVKITVIPAGGLDVVIEIFDSDGNFIVKEDNSLLDPENLTFGPTFNSNYIIRIRGYEFSEGSYSISFSP